MNAGAPTAKMNTKLSGLAARLVEADVLDAEQAAQANREATKAGQSLLSFLVSSHAIDSLRVAEIAAVEFGVPLFDLDALEKAALPDKLIPPELMTKHRAVPLFRRGNRLFVGVSDPTNLAALDEIKFATGISTDAVLVDEQALSRALAEILEEQNSLDNEMSGLEDDGEYDLEIAEGADTDQRR